MQRDLLTEDDWARIELALLRMERATGSQRGAIERRRRELEHMSGAERRPSDDRVMDGPGAERAH